MAELKTLMKNESVFVAVGAGHLMGEGIDCSAEKRRLYFEAGIE